MLNKNNRIGNRYLIEKLFGKGNLYKNKLFTFRYLPSTEPVSKFAVIVSLKICKKAVERNTLRRQIFESVRLNLNSIKTPLVALIIAKPNAANADYKAINDSVADFINQDIPNVQ
jgi:ribonuclease P protein component